MATSAVNAVGVLGGTFDPIHLGHLRLGWEALNGLGLSEVRFVPCHLPAHRESPHCNADHRLAMVTRACADVPGFRVDDWEIRRHEPSYSLHTLTHLRQQQGEHTPLVFLLGMDAFRQFSTWHQWPQILELVHLGVARRPGAAAPAGDSTEGQLLSRHQCDAQTLHQHPAGRIVLFDTTALDIASTRLRQQMAAGLSPRFLLPDSVRAYIEQHHLYCDRKADPAND